MSAACSDAEAAAAEGRPLLAAFCGGVGSSPSRARRQATAHQSSCRGGASLPAAAAAPGRQTCWRYSRSGAAAAASLALALVAGALLALASGAHGPRRVAGGGGWGAHVAGEQQAFWERANAAAPTAAPAARVVELQQAPAAASYLDVGLAGKAKTETTPAAPDDGVGGITAGSTTEQATSATDDDVGAGSTTESSPLVGPEMDLEEVQDSPYVDGGTAASAMDEPVGGSVLWETVCAEGDVSATFSFCNSSLSLDERAAGLVAVLSPEEKQSLLGNKAAGVPRLGLPPYQWWSEGLHGAREPCVTAGSAVRCPTIFPAPSAMAASFNDSLFLAMGKVVGLEGRAISNVRAHDASQGDGLTYWAPNVNMQRDPRWGRNQEAPGEDPLLTSRYAVNFVRGVQEGPSPDRVQMAAACKHFIGNELESSVVDGAEVTRHNFDAQIPLQDLADYYLPAFESCVKEGRSVGIMCSYNMVNGLPMCANTKYLTDILRRKWGFDGYVTSDCWAVDDIFQSHLYVGTGADATAAALNAGTDVDCGDQFSSQTLAALAGGRLRQEAVDRALRRLVKVQMRLGLFDPKSKSAYFDASNYGMRQIDAPAHRRLALEAALQSIVLLKNGKGSAGSAPLPLKRGARLALMGRHVGAKEALVSNYHGERCPEGGFGCLRSPLEAIRALNAQGEVTLIQSTGSESSQDDFAALVEPARAADALVLLVGLDTTDEREELDRVSCRLQGSQHALVEAAAALGRPTVLVLIHGGALCLGPLKDKVDAIVDSFYGGQSGSEALAAVLFGDHNPSGKLPVTMYTSEHVAQMPITQMSVAAPPGRSHMYFTGVPEFPFGSGLSYSRWRLELAEAGGELAAGTGSVRFAVRVVNEGPLAGGQRVLAFARPLARPPDSSVRQLLWSYQGVDLDAGREATLSFELRSEALATSDPSGSMVVRPGPYEVVFSHGGGGDLRANVTVTGDAYVARGTVF